MRDLISIGMIPEYIDKIAEHEHTVWEIVYYTHGMGILKIGDEEVQFEPGDIVCQPPGKPHSEYSKDGFRNIFFCVSAFDNPGIGIPRFKDTDSGDFHNILMQVYREYHIKRNNWRRIVDGLVDVLYQYMVAWRTEKRKNPLVERFEYILVSNISNKSFKLEKAFKDIPLSCDHFRKVFKKETGKTPLDYLTEKRIDYAKRLLDDRHVRFITVKEAANLSGFDDPYYFSRVFKKVTGKSPVDWGVKS